MAFSEEQYKILRQLLSKAIGGPNTDTILKTLSLPINYLVKNVQAIHNNAYIVTASERYLDERLADFGIVRPPKVGLSDDVFRNIGISIINKKQVRELLMRILNVIFGESLTQANVKSGNVEPYNLDDDDILKISFDGGPSVDIVFKSDQFLNINAATAQEIADVITKSLRSQGKTGRAFAQDDGAGAYVVVSSDTNGPQSTVQILGGRAQNVLQFPEARPTTGGPSTQWTITLVSGGSARFTWTGGANPNVGKVRIGDYVNIFGSGFSSSNRGVFTITDVKGGPVSSAYFEVFNPTAVAEVVTQGTADAILFYNPVKIKLSNRSKYAAVFQEEASLLEVFIPATTRIIRRERKGAAYIHEPVITNTVFTFGKNKIVDLTLPSPSSIVDGSYFNLDAADGTLYYVYFSNSPFVDPMPPLRTGILVDITGLTTATQVAQAAAAAINANPNFNVLTPPGPTIRVSWNQSGVAPTPVNVSLTGLGISVFQEGVNEVSTTTSSINPESFLPDQEGPYSFDLTQPFVLSEVATTLTSSVFLGSGNVINVVSSASFPEAENTVNYLMFNYGKDNQEGPVPYLNRPSNTTLLTTPAYVFKNTHDVGSEVRLVSQIGTVLIAENGADYPAYITDVVSGRIYAENLINELKAAGINVIIYILYPGDEGLSKYFTDDSEKVVVWGDDNSV